MTAATNNQQNFSPAEIEAVKTRVDILAMIGGKVALKKRSDHWVGLCPFHHEGSPSFCVFPKKQNFHCFGCSEGGDVFTWLKKTEGLSFGAAMARLKGDETVPRRRFISASAAGAQTHDDAEDLRKRIDKARKIWDEAMPAFGTLVERYLASRGLSDVIIPPTIRFHPRLWNAEKNTCMPGMVAAVTDARQNIIAVHRTWLLPDGRGKANLQSSKKMLGPTRGGHVCLQPVTMGTLAVAEGIETALTVASAKPNIGVWAALSLGNMDALVPCSVRELILCADGDNKDPKSADAILDAAVRKHRERNPRCLIRIARPAKGKDFNDMVRGES